jgi:hypothetical protein
MANTLKLYRQGAVGFIDLLGLWWCITVTFSSTPLIVEMNQSAGNAYQNEQNNSKPARHMR